VNRVAQHRGQIQTDSKSHRENQLVAVREEGGGGGGRGRGESPSSNSDLVRGARGRGRSRSTNFCHEAPRRATSTNSSCKDNEGTSRSSRFDFSRTAYNFWEGSCSVFLLRGRALPDSGYVGDLGRGGCHPRPRLPHHPAETTRMCSIVHTCFIADVLMQTIP
jgi:hypothetical protein